MGKKNIKVIFCLAITVIVLLSAWFGMAGINKTIDKTVCVEVFEDNDGTYKSSSITVSGHLKKTLFPSECSFVGTFAIECYEPSCPDGVEAKIEWFDEGYQDITFFYAGDFSHFDVEKIEIDEQMDNMMIVLSNGTIIATNGYYIPGSIWMQYKNNH